MSPFSRTEVRDLYEAHGAALYRLLYRLTRDACDAEDLMQETFLTVWRKRAQFEGRGSVEGWLRRAAYRHYLNWLERARTRRERTEELDGPSGAAAREGAAADGPEPAESVSHEDALGFLAARVAEALDSLPDRAREAFVLFRYEGLSRAEIAELTGAPLKTVEWRLASATRLLAERLRPYRHHVPAR